ncbi:unnamed protein product [Cylindrotheca closterium]|uniref:NAD-dependent epimerase/dehydratase domain-containing protein n=1 Tax=Cylindrotheca closterium TaxID=2856 RepID=A0AAD2G6N4_9STRA|nr:unnamed protein product [Cylindrotheca closterium]
MDSSNKTSLVIVGATGLVGTELIRILDKTKYRITIVGRSREKLERTFPHGDGVEDYMTWDDFEKADAKNWHVILNLAGASVSGTPWTDAYKQTMIYSRLNATNMCVKKCGSSTQHKIRLINASAVSAYGFYTKPFHRFTEKDRDRRDTSSPPTFLQDLIDQWEEAAFKAEAFGSPVTVLRTGVVLDMKEAFFCHGYWKGFGSAKLFLDTCICY